MAPNSPGKPLVVENLSKTFGGEHALREVDFEVRPGEVHALIGSNGSGKSTMIKVLAGFHQPDPGARALIGEAPFHLGNSHDAEANGIRFVHQELGLIGNMDSVDNVGLGRGFEVSGGRIRWRVERKRVRKLLDRLGVHIDVRIPVESLSLAQRTMIAIARAIDVGAEHGGVRFLVLDEPTASLGGQDARRLFEVVERIRDEGVGVILVSHHLDEVLGIADRVTVLRDGTRIGTFDKTGLDRDKLIHLMTGRRLAAVETQTATRKGGEPALSVRGLTGTVLDGIDLDLWPGEILGIAGLLGSGMEELPPLLLGLVRRKSGDVRVTSSSLRRVTPARAHRHGMWFVSGDRGKYGVFPTFSVYENITISDLGPFAKWGVLRRRAERAGVQEWMHTFDIQPPSSTANIMNLSGGNQQKAVLAKVLRTRPRILVLDDPTRGVDVAAKAEIHRVMDQAAANDTAILLCSSDHDEIARLCDRTLVLRKGVIARELSRSEVDADTLGDLVI
ncbi:sugar ABC transporter ATP-binding protein [Amycolatopsis sp. NPDC005232]|uniref:sugar ABC transporter ATP-binding protein n=1 Tax=Amycolatopsis sp. NPDC005232 TaxID=3157027 RepID=UPI0033B2EA6B